AAADPKNRSYWAHAHALQTRALLEQADRKAAEKVAEKALLEPDTGADSDPETGEEPEVETDLSPPLDTVITDQDLRPPRWLAPPPELAGAPGKKSLDLREEQRALWEKAARAFGLEPVFEREFPQTGQPMRFRVEDVDFREAIHSLEIATSSFVVPLDQR